MTARSGSRYVVWLPIRFCWHGSFLIVWIICSMFQTPGNRWGVHGSSTDYGWWSMQSGVSTTTKSMFYYESALVAQMSFSYVFRRWLHGPRTSV